MLFKKFFSLVCFALFIQSSNQQAHAITEQQTNIASYIIAAGAGAATGGLVFYALEQNDKSDNDILSADSAKNEENNHFVRNLIIGSVCGVIVGALVYKISHDVVAPRIIDQETRFCEIKLFIRDSKDGELHEVPVPDNFMLDDSPENFNKFLKWIKETYKNSYEYEYQKKDTVQKNAFFEKSSFSSNLSGRATLNPNAPDREHKEEILGKNL